MAKRATRKQATAVKEIAPIGFLSDEVSDLLQDALDPEIYELLSSAEELTQELIDEVSEAGGEEINPVIELLTEHISSSDSEVEPEPEAQDTGNKRIAARKAARLARQERQTAPTATTRVPKKTKAQQKAEDDGATLIDNVGILLEAMDIDMSVILTKIGKNKYALQSVATLDIPTGKRRKRSKARADKLKTDEYKSYLADMRKMSFEEKIEYAESLDLVRGTDWKQNGNDGTPLPEGIEWMKLSPVIREKLGIVKEIVVESEQEEEVVTSANGTE